jgi:hypothetical protein
VADNKGNGLSSLKLQQRIDSSGAAATEVGKATFFFKMMMMMMMNLESTTIRLLRRRRTARKGAFPSLPSLPFSEAVSE